MLKRYHRLVYLYYILPATRTTTRVGETILYYKQDVLITPGNDCSWYLKKSKILLIMMVFFNVSKN